MIHHLTYILICNIITGHLNSFKGFNYVGCYRNDLNNTLANRHSPSATTIECFLTCISAGQNFMYAGTQKNPLACYCGKDIRDHGTYPGKHCDVPCPLTSRDICGGFNKLAVYNITDENIPVVIKQQQVDTTTVHSTDFSTPEYTCQCPCIFTSNKWSFLKDVNISREQLVSLLKLDLEELKQNLTVPVKTTSAYKNSKRSATDDRTSSIMIGWIGGFITCIPIILIISADIMKLFRNRQNKVNKLL